MLNQIGFQKASLSKGKETFKGSCACGAREKGFGPRHSRGVRGGGRLCGNELPSNRSMQGKAGRHDEGNPLPQRRLAAINSASCLRSALALRISISHGTFCGAFLLGWNYTVGRSRLLYPMPRPVTSSGDPTCLSASTLPPQPPALTPPPLPSLLRAFLTCFDQGDGRLTGLPAQGGPLLVCPPRCSQNDFCEATSDPCQGCSVNWKGKATRCPGFASSAVSVPSHTLPCTPSQSVTQPFPHNTCLPTPPCSGQLWSASVQLSRPSCVRPSLPPLLDFWGSWYLSVPGGRCLISRSGLLAFTPALSWGAGDAQVGGQRRRRLSATLKAPRAEMTCLLSLPHPVSLGSSHFFFCSRKHRSFIFISKDVFSFAFST